MPPEAEDLLSGLDPEQRQIAECLRGPVSVLAGAGTGKTRTITHRIAYGVRTGVYDPGRVLAVTFTRKAAGELQGRLRGLGAEGVRAQTFHGAALAQLGHFWPELVGGAAPHVLSGKVSTLSQVAEAQGIRLSSETLRDIAAEIEWRKVSMLGLERYGELLGSGARTAPGGLTIEQVMGMHEGYGRLLEERRQIDFEDVLILLTGMLETEPRVALQVRERYRFFTVDEYQDVSPLQHALLNVWLGGRDDVCVVGDASQTIYSFAGATSSYLLRFAQEHPNAREFRLERNYRSTEPIVRAANRLMRDRPGALTLHAERGGAPASAPRAEWFAEEQEEAAAVAASIRASIAAGTPAHQIAVLYRSNAQSARVEAALAELGIDSRVHGAQRFFDRADVRQAVMLIRGEAKVRDGRPLFQIVSDALRACGWTANPPEGAAAREKWNALNAILSLVDEQPPGTDIVAFSEELLARARAHHEPSVDAVTLSAIHAAKGLEWSLVHLIGMSEGLLPISYALAEEASGRDAGTTGTGIGGSGAVSAYDISGIEPGALPNRPFGDSDALEEERRLCYVAITRARDELRLSGSAAAGRARRAPSRFLAEAGIEGIASLA